MWDGERNLFRKCPRCFHRQLTHKEEKGTILLSPFSVERKKVILRDPLEMAYEGYPLPYG